ncbi:MAG: hypothetical protein JW741_26185 [Sedimentisphaerales bacterium]|nr:hypothetical protein [Sedimentisphaerales bacterium]
MRDILKKIGIFCENHVEKIVLVMVGLVCIWLFFTRVTFSPNVVSVGDKTFSPGQIDDYVKARADELQQRLAGSSGPGTAEKPYTPRTTGPIGPNEPVNIFGRPLPRGFAGVFDSPLSYLELDAVPPQPSRGGAGRFLAKYTLPQIGGVTNVAANHIRAAAWVPLQEVTPEATYDKAEVEPNDIDLVTVEAQFDVASLYRQYQAHFAGEEVAKDEWRDPCLADPIFAAVQLQRQELLADGTWSPWQEVRRTRVDPYQELFQSLDRVEDLPPGGVEVRLMQFDRKDIAMQLLQPEAYQIASAEEDWFPPSFYDKFKQMQKKVEMEERRKEREEKRDQQEQDIGRRRTAAGGTAGSRGTTGTGAGGRFRTNRAGGGAGDAMYNRGSRTRGRNDRTGAPGTDPRSRSGRRGRTGAEDPMYGEMYMDPDGLDGRRGPSTDEVYWEFSEKLMNYATDLTKLDEPLLFWAMDDSVEPGNTYQYRVRIGVFNPVAGTDRLAEEDADKKNQVILWSDFSEVTKPQRIPEMLYLFAKDVQEQTKTAVVEVARYTLGYWRSEDFKVKPGEVIGKEVEPEIEEDTRSSRQAPTGRITDPLYARSMGMGPGGGLGAPKPRGMMGPDDVYIPEMIDYRTGKVLVDLVQVNDWGTPPNLQPRGYHEMLYTTDGLTIEHMPVKSGNWSKDLLTTYQYVASEKRKEPQPFRDFKKGGLRGRGGRGGRMDGYEGMDGMYDEMMYMQDGLY